MCAILPASQEEADRGSVRKTGEEVEGMQSSPRIGWGDLRVSTCQKQKT